MAIDLTRHEKSEDETANSTNMRPNMQKSFELFPNCINSVVELPSPVVELPIELHYKKN